jgi:hypothetical protein
MKNTIFTFALAFAALLAGGCSQPDEHGSSPTSASAQQKFDSAEDRQKIHRNAAENFLEHLKNGKELYSFFSDNWTLVYHDDNRADGSTDGERVGLPRVEIDKTIEVKVINDGDGWANDDKRAPTEYVLNFSLKERVASWDEFEIPDYENQTKGVVTIQGSGVSDYLVLHYGNHNLIVKMEYRSEDPG